MSPSVTEEPYEVRLREIAEFVRQADRLVYAEHIQRTLGGWPGEITAKLKELRKRGLVAYDQTEKGWRWVR